MPPAPVLAPDPAAAGSLAAAYAADYLSWDEADPGRRRQALARYLAADRTADPGLLGWSGSGRQRADFALPGLISPDGDRIMVDVRVRITPFRRVAGPQPVPPPVPPPGPGPSPEDVAATGMPAAAPAPDAPGWLSLGSHWVRLAVPIVRDGDRLVVDALDELWPG